MRNLFDNVALIDVAHVDAPVRVTSAQIDDALAPALQGLGMPAGTLEQLTGIRARRFQEPGVSPSAAATMAAERLLQRAGVKRESIDLLINSSVCRDFVEPSTASLVHAGLGLGPHCASFDIGNACLGFLDAMALAAHQLERGAIDLALIVDGEDARYVVEQTLARLIAAPEPAALRDEFAALTLGSGAAAMLLGRASEHPDAVARLRGGVSLAATEHNGLCRGQRDRMITDSGQLLYAGVALAERTFAEAREHLGWTPEELDLLVMHQVSRAHAEAVTRRLGLSLERAHWTYEERGNIGPAAIPITLSEARDLGRLKAGDRAALMGIGSGLNCAMMEVQWKV